MGGVPAVADIVAMSSISEAFPYTVIESMLCGAAIVATDVGGVSEALGPAGVLVNARDPEAMAAALCELLASPTSAGGSARRRGHARSSASPRIASSMSTASATEARERRPVDAVRDERTRSAIRRQFPGRRRRLMRDAGRDSGAEAPVSG